MRLLDALLAGGFCTALAFQPTDARALSPAAEPAARPPAPAATLVATPTALPLHFEPNVGQTDPAVAFLARGRGYTLFLTGTEAVLALQRPGAATAVGPSAAVVRMRLLGANPAPPVAGLGELPGKVNYFIGNDPTRWRTNVPTYAKVKYEGVYPGVDLVYYGQQRHLEYDLVVAPGANPTVIQLAFEGAHELHIDAQGNLLLRVAGGDLRLHKPRLYQEINGVKQAIAGNYILLGPKVASLRSPTPTPLPPTPKVGFQVAAYDRSKPLVIDPVLSYSTYLGGSSDDEGFGIAVDTGVPSGKSC